MVRIAPVRLSFNPKTLWFDAGEMELPVGSAVVVATARGEEFGHVADSVFAMEDSEAASLKNPLKPVKRLATEADEVREREVAELSKLALPIFKSIARESVPDMHPVAVEYLFEGDKAVFYFESEERVDFRDLVRALAAEFHVRIDMKQIGVRDGARIIGGLGHCGQELCCRRLGGEFQPVSIRMAKEQDLSLNPQKISGRCGRLMCCLRYENDAYKDFHSRAPKKNAKIETPDGVGKVVDLDVPRETVSIKVEDEKPVKVPLDAMEKPEGGGRPNAVGEVAWQRATEPEPVAASTLHLFGTSELTGEDKLAEPGKIRHTGQGKKDRSERSQRRRGSGGSKGAEGTGDGGRKQRRRRTTVGADGQGSTESTGNAKGRSRRQRSSKSTKDGAKKTVQVGRNSSGLRNPPKKDPNGPKEKSGPRDAASGQRRRRRSHRTGSDEAPKA